MEQTQQPPRESEFWRFSLQFYALPDVAPACLVLQDEADVDVNLLLYLLFLARSKRQTVAADIARLDGAVLAWRKEAVKPLRGLRRALKTGIGDVAPAASETFRNMIKKVELEAERIEQMKLEEVGAGMRFEEAPSREEAARANLGAYARFAGSFPQSPLGIILSAFAAMPG